MPLLPELSLPGTEVPAPGPELVYGSRYDYVITCDPRVPMWLDDGDGLLSWQATDRPIQCEEGQLAMIVVSVRFEEARLLTLYEDDIGVPIAYRTLTGTPFAPEAVEAVAAATGAELVDVEVPCYDTWVGNLTVGEHRAECVFMHTPARAVDVPLRDLLTAARLSPNFEREVAIHAS